VSIESIRTIAVLGAGTMGNGIAHVFARAGYKVLLRDVEQHFLDRALDSIAKNLDREIKKGKLEPAEKGTVLARLVPVTDMSTIANADFVVEAVPEKLDLKRHVLTEVTVFFAMMPSSPATHPPSPSPRLPLLPSGPTALWACTS